MQRTDRHSLYHTFVERFRTAKTVVAPLVPVDSAEIDRAESLLDCKLPDSYRSFVTEFGAGDTGSLDDDWFSLLPHTDCPTAIGEVWGPRQIIRQCNEHWYAPI